MKARGVVGHKPGQPVYCNDFACPSSPCIFVPRKEGGGDAEATKNRGVPAHSPKAGIRLSACLPAGLPRDLEEGSRPSLLPTASGSAFVCLAALRGQEEAAGPGNNGSFSRVRLLRSDRGHGTVARRRAQPLSTATTGACAPGDKLPRRQWGPLVGCGETFPSPSLFPRPQTRLPCPGGEGMRGCLVWAHFMEETRPAT